MVDFRGHLASAFPPTLPKELPKRDLNNKRRSGAPCSTPDSRAFNATSILCSLLRRAPGSRIQVNRVLVIERTSLTLPRVWLRWREAKYIQTPFTVIRVSVYSHVDGITKTVRSPLT
jgi:hypothetical protein